MTHLLVTNDFLPKIGGIQTYLWELWRRLPSERVVVLTTPFSGDQSVVRAFDAAAPMKIIRTRQRWLLPTPILRNEIIRVARQEHATHIVLDPAFPLGAIGPSLVAAGFTYSVVLHGAEVAIPGRLPISSAILRYSLRRAAHSFAAGPYPLAEAQHCAKQPLSSTVVPPGVDLTRFTPASPERKATIRQQFGLAPLGGPPIISATSRHVPRKGIDTLISAAGKLAPEFPGLTLAIASTGRQTADLQRLAARARRASGDSLDVRFFGRVDDRTLTDLYAAADLNATLCRTRWFGLEQEGFGIIFVEAGACGVASIAGDSGGAKDAVVDGVTGAIVARPVGVKETVPVLRSLLVDRARLAEMGAAARVQATKSFDYDDLAAQLDSQLIELERRSLPTVR
jgi:phosphatidyl-myo-inositol dimannoside synthase